MAAVAALAGLARDGVAAGAGPVRYEGDLGLGWAYADCPDLGRAGLAILRCDDQRPDHGLLLAANGRLEVDTGPASGVFLEERLRSVWPRLREDLAALDAVSEVGLRFDRAPWRLSAGALLALHLEPDPRWQSVRNALLAGAVYAGSDGFEVEVRADFARADFPLDYARNTYAIIDHLQGRVLARARYWAGPAARVGFAYEGTFTSWSTNLGALLEDLVRLEGRPRRDGTHAAEGELLVRPHPAVAFSLAARGEVTASNVAVFRSWAVGPAGTVAFAGGGHRLAVTVRWLYARFPDAVVAPRYFTNVREDHRLEVLVRWRADLGARAGVEVTLGWIDSESSDARLYDLVCARPENVGCVNPAVREEVLSSITSYSRYEQTTAEVRLFVRW